MSHRAALLALWVGASTACSLAQPRPVAATGPSVRPRQEGVVDLVFDRGSGAYEVVGRPDHYWYRDRYYRWAGDHWLVSTRLDRDWTECSQGALPAGLARKHTGGPLPASPAR
jgi:hypothetical protein